MSTYYRIRIDPLIVFAVCVVVALVVALVCNAWVSHSRWEAVARCFDRHYDRGFCEQLGEKP